MRRGREPRTATRTTGLAAPTTSRAGAREQCRQEIATDGEEPDVDKP